MSDLTLELINLISQGKTINEISEILNVSNKKLYNYITLLKNKGFDYERKYYYNGDIVYVPRKNLLTNPLNEVNIITTPEDQTFTAVVISDLHIGNELERIDLLNKVYDYCIKEGINIIINAGDLIDGTFGKGNKKYSNTIEQIDYALQVYPFDKNILNFTVLGNHDFSALENTGQDLAIILQNYRHDIIPIGYERGEINIKNDKIIVRHPINQNTESLRKFNSSNCNLFLDGHSHKMSFSINGNTIIHVPSLSDINVTNDNILPSAIKITLDFNHGKFEKGIAKQLLITDKIYALNELPFYLNTHQIAPEIIKYEETPVKKLIKKEEKYTPGMSQIDKFNARFGIK